MRVSEVCRSEWKPQGRTVERYDSATMRARAFNDSFISEISRSTSSMNLCGRGCELAGQAGDLDRASGDDALDDKVDELVLHHLLNVLVGDQEADIVALDRDTSEDDKRLGALLEEPRELVAQDLLDLVCLLDPQRHANAVD